MQDSPHIAGSLLQMSFKTHLTESNGLVSHHALGFGGATREGGQDRENRREKDAAGVLNIAAVYGGGIVSVQAVEEHPAGAKPQDVSLKDLKGTLPQGTIGKLKDQPRHSRRQSYGGGAHSRDLAYAGPLMRAYHTDEKIFETFELAERASINTFWPLRGRCRCLTNTANCTLPRCRPSAR